MDGTLKIFVCNIFNLFLYKYIELFYNLDVTQPDCDKELCFIERLNERLLVQDHSISNADLKCFEAR